MREGSTKTLSHGLMQVTSYLSLGSVLTQYWPIHKVTRQKFPLIKEPEKQKQGETFAREDCGRKGETQNRVRGMTSDT